MQKEIKYLMRVIYASVCFLLIFNIFLSPYPRELTMLGIKPGINDDAVIAALTLNGIALLLLSIGWFLLVRSKRFMNIIYIGLTIINLVAIFYWLRYL